MKKIFKLFLILFAMIILVGCDTDLNEQETTYKVTFVNNLVITHQEEVLEGETVTPFELTEREGYKYYWYKDNKTIPFDFSTKIYRDITLTTFWYEEIDVETFTVIFINEGNIVKELTLDKNSTISPVKLDDRPGFSYYWYLDDESVEFNFNSYKVTSDLELKAYWFELEKINVKFIDNNIVINEIEIEAGSTIEPVILIKDNNNDYYWYSKDENRHFNFETKIYEDLELRSKWYSKNYSSSNLEIYYINDTHGAVLRSGNELGMAYIGNYIKNQSNRANMEHLFIAGGDIFQGQLISNSNKGSLMVEILNELNLEAFVIGNHEFDWGINEIQKFFDPRISGVKADFPLLGANIKLKATNERPEFVDSHTIIHKNGLNIGIIGVIGDGLETSIATIRVKDYYFSDAYNAVADTAKKINDQVDIILVVNHAGDLDFNEKAANISKVSAVFNGHTHSAYTGKLNGKIPYIQSGANGNNVGNVSLNINSNKQLNIADVKNEKYHSLLESPDNTIQAIIDRYYSEIRHLYEEVILISAGYYSEDALASYIAKVMQVATNSTLGLQNSGGTRATLNYNQEIVAADLFKIFPFDNLILYAEISGRNLKTLYNNSYFYTSGNLDTREIDNNKLYRVATNDYVYYSSYQVSIFGNIQPAIYGDMYETLYQVMLNLKASGKTHFNINDPIIIN